MSENKRVLGRMDILEAQDLKHEDVDCPDWGGLVRIRSLTAKERSEYEASWYDMVEGKMQFKKDEFSSARQKLVALTAVDEEGNRLFTDEDVKLLESKSAAMLEKCHVVAQKLSGIGNVAEAQKNLAANPTAASSTV